MWLCSVVIVFCNSESNMFVISKIFLAYPESTWCILFGILAYCLQNMILLSVVCTSLKCRLYQHNAYYWLFLTWLHFLLTVSCPELWSSFWLLFQTGIYKTVWACDLSWGDPVTSIRLMGCWNPGTNSSCSLTSLQRNSRMLLRSTFRPSACREYGVSPAPFTWISQRSPFLLTTSPRYLHDKFTTQAATCNSETSNAL